MEFKEAQGSELGRLRPQMEGQTDLEIWVKGIDTPKPRGRITIHVSKGRGRKGW